MGSGLIEPGDDSRLCVKVVKGNCGAIIVALQEQMSVI